MLRFLFASTPVVAHSTNPLPIAARLVERGHRVEWYAGRAFHAQIAAVGARPLPFVAAEDISTSRLWERCADQNARSELLRIAQAYADVFVGSALARVQDLTCALAGQAADAVLCDCLMFGVDLLHELGGPAWATYGDTPLIYRDDDTPPFGAGLLPMRGPLGRLRNRAVSAVASRLLFASARRVYRETRATLKLPPSALSQIECVTSPYLHMQGCTPSFEYPRTHLPEHVHWIGALRPARDRSFVPPSWWRQATQSTRPLIHVTQGSLRGDLHELIVPSIRALASLDAWVVVTTGGADAAAVVAALGHPLPDNTRIATFIPYDRLLKHTNVFVTNGGYTGVTLALSHGVPIVQAGMTEEKAEIGSRIVWSGVGVRLRTSRPRPSALRCAVERVLGDASFRHAAARVQREMQEHDAAGEAADRLEQLATTRAVVQRDNELGSGLL